MENIIKMYTERIINSKTLGEAWSRYRSSIYFLSDCKDCKTITNDEWYEYTQQVEKAFEGKLFND